MTIDPRVGDNSLVLGKVYNHVELLTVVLDAAGVVATNVNFYSLKESVLSLIVKDMALYAKLLLWCLIFACSCHAIHLLTSTISLERLCLTRFEYLQYGCDQE